jgi:hypothetical protein
MATSYTTFLGLALPVTGELSGTWGDTVNNYISNYIDAAVAGAQTVTTDTTLTKTTGTTLGATSSQYAIIIASPASANITITAPAASKIYTIINTSATYTVKIVGAGPTTGVTLGVSEKAQVAWNGSDFVRIGASGGVGVFSSITNTALTSGRVVYSTTGGLETDSANLLFNGTTLTANTLNLTNALGTTYGGTGLTSFTANGVVYASSSSALTTGSALTFNGTSLVTTGSATGTAFIPSGSTVPTNGMYLPSTNTVAWSTNTTEVMRLDSSGNLGLGVTPSAWSGYTAFQVKAASLASSITEMELSANCYYNSGWKYYASNGIGTSRYEQYNGIHAFYSAPSGTAGNAITFTQAMTLDASGNLAVGITSYRTAASYNAFALNGTVGSLFDLYAGGTRVGGIAATSISVAVSSITSIPLVFSTADIERARIDSSGNLGIGTSSPLGSLGIVGSTTTTIVIPRSSNGTTGSPVETQLISSTFTNGSYGAGIFALNAFGSTSANWLTFKTTDTGNGSPVERMRLDASGNLGLGTTSPNASAILDAQSTTKGVRMPNMTTTQKNAIASPAAGLMVFDTTLSKLCVYSGAAWQTITSV